MLSYDSPVPIAGKTTVDMANIPSNPNQATATKLATTPGISSASADGTIAPQNADTEKTHHIWLVTGPAGSGKTSVAKYLGEELGLPYIEGDNFHSKENIEKMEAGTPLTDADRWDWLTDLREESLRKIHGGSAGVVVTCSALKQKYRDVIRVAGYFDRSLVIHFIYLSVSESVLLERVQARSNHYMGANMVHSQVKTLEPPKSNERDVISVEASRTQEEVKKEVLERVVATMKDEGSEVNGQPL